jgi:hypothetical protein
MMPVVLLLALENLTLLTLMLLEVAVFVPQVSIAVAAVADVDHLVVAHIAPVTPEINSLFPLMTLEFVPAVAPSEVLSAARLSPPRTLIRPAPVTSMRPGGRRRPDEQQRA